jgi:hypothetical protein
LDQRIGLLPTKMPAVLENRSVKEHVLQLAELAELKAYAEDCGIRTKRPGRMVWMSVIYNCNHTAQNKICYEVPAIFSNPLKRIIYCIVYADPELHGRE